MEKKTPNDVETASKAEVGIVITTKEFVDRSLEANVRNRKPKPFHIEKLKTEMSVGQWFLTASGIGFSEDGILIDGQNRLIANREAGYPPIPLVVVRGLKFESQRAVDKHARRSTADTLSLLLNQTVTNSIIAAIRSITTIQGSTSRDENFISSSWRKPTERDIQDFFIEYQDFLSTVVSRSGQARGPVCAALFIYALNDFKGMEELSAQIKTGANLDIDDPAYRLRDIILKNKGNNGSKYVLDLFCYSVSAVVSHAQRKQVKQLKRHTNWSGAPKSWDFWPDYHKGKI